MFVRLLDDIYLYCFCCRSLENRLSFLYCSELLRGIHNVSGEKCVLYYATAPLLICRLKSVTLLFVSKL